MRAFVALSVLAVVLLAMPGSAFAQADEIQVYDGGLAAPGVFNLTWHNNFTSKGMTTPGFPGGVVADKSWNGVPEWAYGVTRWFEAGLYMPLYTRDKNLGWGLDGFKLRTLFAVPNADNRRFVYGANFEFSYNARRWDSTRFTSEIRPIIGWHFKTVDFIVNPIVDTAYDGLKNLEFVPATRVAFTINQNWQIAAEEYDDFGRVSDFLPAGEQAHQIYFVVDRMRGPVDVEAGIGFGLTENSDKLTFKVILSHDFNKPRSAKE
jgi:opacity protein-like surface antigen